MFTVNIPEQELFIASTNEFVQVKATKFSIEHSLRSLHRWEQKWHIPFLSENSMKTEEMAIDYVRCMTITQNVDPNIYKYIPQDVMRDINDYVQNPSTATTFSLMEESKAKHGRKNEIVTAEIIYYWMIALNIPVEFQNWHLESLLTLIKVCSIKQEEQNPNAKKKMSRSQLNARNSRINAARRKALHSKG